ncbi:unnamed protein product, partial [Chrysoparadoxa australica]
MRGSYPRLMKVRKRKRLLCHCCVIDPFPVTLSHIVFSSLLIGASVPIAPRPAPRRPLELLLEEEGKGGRQVLPEWILREMKRREEPPPQPLPLPLPLLGGLVRYPPPRPLQQPPSALQQQQPPKVQPPYVREPPRSPVAPACKDAEERPASEPCSAANRREALTQTGEYQLQSGLLQRRVQLGLLLLVVVNEHWPVTCHAPHPSDEREHAGGDVMRESIGMAVGQEQEAMETPGDEGSVSMSEDSVAGEGMEVRGQDEGEDQGYRQACSEDEEEAKDLEELKPEPVAPGKVDLVERGGKAMEEGEGGGLSRADNSSDHSNQSKVKGGEGASWQEGLELKLARLEQLLSEWQMRKAQREEDRKEVERLHKALAKQEERESAEEVKEGQDRHRLLLELGQLQERTQAWVVWRAEALTHIRSLQEEVTELAGGILC